MVMEFIISFSIYPEGIFNNVIKTILYTVLPVAFIVYIPARVLVQFSIVHLACILGMAVLWITIAYTVFYRGLKKYESGNLIISKL